MSIKHIKDKTEGFDDYFPCRKKNLQTRECNTMDEYFADNYNKK
ncbi:MAG TPA: hypothetical protein VFX18_03845 [Candidatus Nitrosocosmicus sp.]|jgi:hypothetical protein|nr:hypothetical protein [Candidatus Nitrosocosmicus sp.]